MHFKNPEILVPFILYISLKVDFYFKIIFKVLLIVWNDRFIVIIFIVYCDFEFCHVILNLDEIIIYLPAQTFLTCMYPTSSHLPVPDIPYSPPHINPSVNLD